MQEAVRPTASQNALHTADQNQFLKTVLAIDDEEVIRSLVADSLFHSGFNVLTAQSAEEAILILRDTDVDCILCDVKLPGMDGIAFAQLASKSFGHIPVVIVTAIAEVELAKAAMQNGACDFVTKPLGMINLPILIESAIEKHRLRGVRQVEHEHQTRFKVIQALAAAIDAKQALTAEHSRRVTMIAGIIGRALGLSADDLIHLEMASLVHDVGKIGVPDEILNKPGPLTNEEWVIMKRHSEQGALIVAEVPELASISTIVRHHHERMDGNGYPDALVGEDIPLLSRVIAVADAFECMTGSRVYRDKLDSDIAISRLQDCAGTQFDSAIVECFIRTVSHGVVIN